MTHISNRTERYDVLVLGGGTAGVVAAIQAARAGAKTLLVEKTGMLGGTMTNGGVNFPGLFHAWGRQVIGGIGWELVSRAVAEAGDTLPDFTDYKRPHWQLHVRVDAFLYAALCDEAAVAAGVDLLFHAMPAALAEAAKGDGWDVTLCTKTGLSTCRARVVIDATGDANAASLAGLPVILPDETQPSTLSCLAGGYDPAQLDIEAINRAFDSEVRAGRLAYTDASWNTAAANVGKWLGKRGSNASHVHYINARDSAGKTRLELEARKSLLRLYRFLRRQPGLEALNLAQLAPECGVRETAVIRGTRTVTVEDYCSGRLWEDAVCYSFYPIDLHTSAGGGLRCEPLREGVVPTVPRGALLPEGSRNFLVAGRCLSSDRLANSALRVQATCMATGQAAGALAALASRAGIDPEAVPLSDAHRLLRSHGAIVPERCKSAFPCTMKQTPDFDIPTTSDYAVYVGGQPADLYAMPTRYGQTLENGKPVSVYDGAPLRHPMYFACADIGGPTAVTVEIGFLNADDIRSVTAHPLSRGIEVRREGARVTFEVDRPGTVTLLVNGNHRDRPLHLFFSPPVEAPPEGAIIFGPGYHDLGYDNPISLTDGQTLYLAPGAWVEGVVSAKNARNIRIMGRGVLSQRRPGKLDYAGGATAPNGIILTNCQDVLIEGIVETRGIGGWCSLVTNCDRVAVRDYHVLASVVWSADGFNPCNSRDVTVERCFIRSGDDCIAIKGNTGGSVLTQPHIPPETQPPVENIHVRQSVFWCDHNEVFVIGCETRARHIRNVSMRDCDVVVHSASEGLGVFGIIPLHGTEIRDIVYDDIRVEHCEEQLFCFRFVESIWNIPGDLTFPGTVADITIRNVSVLHAATGPRSEFTGHAPDKRIENVLIDGLRYDGKPVTDAAVMGLRLNEHVADVRFLPQGGRAEIPHESP